MPVFSIIIPFANAQGTLNDTLASLRDQTFCDWEAICVDDGSEDHSASIVERFSAQDHRFRCIKNVGKGPSDARNLAAEQANGRILCFCDADDIWTATKLAELLIEFRLRSVDGIYGRVAFFQKRPGDGSTQSSIQKLPLSIADLLGENPVCTMSNLSVTKQAFMQSGKLDGNCVHNEDLEFLIRFVGAGHELAGVDRMQVWYRTSPNGLSSDLSAMMRGRVHAVETAQRFGIQADAASEAIYMRYLTRRALRLGALPLQPLIFTWIGLRHSASAFLFPLRRGGATALAALAAPLMPREIRAYLFSR